MKKSSKMQRANDPAPNNAGEVDQITAWMEDGITGATSWRNCARTLIRSEEESEEKYAAQYAAQPQKPGMEVGIWIEQMRIGNSAASAGGYPVPVFNPAPSGLRNPVDPGLRIPAYPGFVSGDPGLRNPGMPAPVDMPRRPPTNALTLVFRAVDLTRMDPTADNEIAYAVVRELKAPVFDTKTVQSAAQISPVDASGTFTFIITVAPQNPLRLY